MASNLTVDTLTKGSTTLNTDEIVDTNSSQVCKAWCQYDTVASNVIKDSYNVSSLTDHGTGQHTINFANAMPNAHYSTIGTSGLTDILRVRIFSPYAQTTTGVRISSGYSDTSLRDHHLNSVAIFSN